MKAAVLMGSDSDLPVLESGIKKLRQFGIEVEAHAMSAHRTPEAVVEFARNAEKNGIEVIIAAAGMSAHLAGVIAASTVLPVIGVPVKNGAMNGLDALLSTVMMPPGIPVATVGIDAGDNAALLAVQILSAKYPELREKLKSYRKTMSEGVSQKDARLQAKLAEL